MKKKIKIAIGIKLRPDKLGNARPRWEPWPAARKIGLKGRDLKDFDGNYLDIGAAITAGEMRTKWARAILKAVYGHTHNVTVLKSALLAIGHIAASNQKHFLCNDLIEFAQNHADIGFGTLATPAETATIKDPQKVPPIARTISLGIDLWLKSKHQNGGICQNTLAQYEKNAKPIKNEIGHLNVSAIRLKTAADYLSKWEKHSPGMTNHYRAILSSTWQFIILNEWAEFNVWRGHKLLVPDGRIVIWEPSQTRQFAKWCDENKFPDIGDAIIMMEWTGHLPVDYCKATLTDFEGSAWAFNRQKTSAAVKVGITNAIKTRLALRQTREYPTQIVHNFFAIDFKSGNQLNTNSLRHRYHLARKAAIKADQSFEYLNDLRLADLRDTCLTRLIAAGIKTELACQWTGHSVKTAEVIWNKSYVARLDITAIESAEKLEDFTERLNTFNEQKTN